MLALDYLLKDQGAWVRDRELKGRYFVLPTISNGPEVILFKPDLLMNINGEAVARAGILVCHD